MCSILLEANREAIARVCRRHHVRRLSVFGSAARGDFDAERSDIDLLVEYEPSRLPSMAGLLELQDEFSRLFEGRRVDLVTPAVLRNPYRRRSIECDLEVLHDG